MMVETRFADSRTPQELLSALPKAMPLDGGAFMLPILGHTGVFRFGVPLFKSPPPLEWDQHFKVIAFEPPEKKPKKSRKLPLNFGTEQPWPPRESTFAGTQYVLEEC